MTPNTIGFALLILGLFLLIGKVMRVKIGWVQRLFLPSSVMGGALILLLGPQALGRVAGPWGETGLFTETMVDVWRVLPGLLISVIFATMFLAVRTPLCRTQLVHHSSQRSEDCSRRPSARSWDWRQPPHGSLRRVSRTRCCRRRPTRGAAPSTALGIPSGSTASTGTGTGTWTPAWAPRMSRSRRCAKRACSRSPLHLAAHESTPTQVRQCGLESCGVQRSHFARLGPLLTGGGVGCT